MAKTATIYARVEPEVKEQAEQILTALGIPTSNAVGLFLKQVILHRGLPFEMTLPEDAPVIYDTLSKEQFDAEIKKGLDDIQAGRTYTAKSVEEEMKRDFGV